jgi:hypothetical protein
VNVDSGSRSSIFTAAFCIGDHWTVLASVEAKRLQHRDIGAPLERDSLIANLPRTEGSSLNAMAADFEVVVVAKILLMFPYNYLRIVRPENKWIHVT